MRKVLVVDDNSANLYLLKVLLEKDGLEVITSENGKEALEKARRNPPDLIVSDILMPVMDGYALCRKCKSDKKLKSIPFVFYTATYTSEEEEKFALSIGADRFVVKPQEPEILNKMLIAIMEEKPAVKPPGPKSPGEVNFLKQHNEILFRKLEKKIADLEKVNQDIRVLEERYRLSFEHTTDAIFTIDSDLKVSSMSPIVERILGYKPQKFIGKPVTDFKNILTPESYENIFTIINSTLTGSITPAAVFCLITKDGTFRYGEVSVAPIKRDGTIIGISCIARDITQRHQAEEALKKSEERYRELVSHAPAGIYEVDYETGRFTSVNDVICEYTGYTRNEMLNMNFSSLFTEESQMLMR